MREVGLSTRPGAGEARDQRRAGLRPGPAMLLRTGALRSNSSALPRDPCGLPHREPEELLPGREDRRDIPSPSGWAAKRPAQSLSLALREPERSEGARLVVEALWPSHVPVASARAPR